MQEPIISVGILTAEKIKFALDGKFIEESTDRPFSGVFTISRNKDHFLLETEEGEIRFSNNLTFTPSNFNSEDFTINDVIIGVNFHWQRKEKQKFRGTLKFIFDGDKITVVNLIPIEEYLKSVVSSEMSARSSVQLLKAHAVISRSWLLAQIRKSESLRGKNLGYQSTIRNEEELIRWYDREDHSLYDVCADDHCQRYQGITKIYSETAIEAVEQTSGLTLLYEDEICDARFSKSCGGITEPFHNVWEPVEYPYLISVDDYKYEPDDFDTDFSVEENAEKWITSNPPAFCNTHDKKILSQVLLHYDQETTDFFRWEEEITQQKMQELLKKKLDIDFGSIVDLLPMERGESARLIKLKIVGTKETLTIGKELEIRRALSDTHLYSSAVVIKRKDVVDGIPGSFLLKGAGWGHGVGLCQIGAAVMAEKGYLFDEILLHYYKNSTLKKIY